VKRIFETLFYPRRVPQDLPRAEVLSVAVDGECRGQGVGGMLMQACLERFRSLGIGHVKAAVGAENPGANSYYRKAGFELVITMMHHGKAMNQYVLELKGV
jgi:ribosomal protein S18 acetylase RimI-like enzyme